MASDFSFTDTKSKREFQFIGDVLGHASTGRPGRARWSELTIFKTQRGQYVLVKAGKSILYHATRECGTTGRFFVQRDRRDMYNEPAPGIPCLKCGPGPYDDIVYEENDLITVVVSRTAQGIVESCHIMDDDGVVFLPGFAKAALEAASQADPDIRTAYQVEVVA